MLINCPKCQTPVEYETGDIGDDETPNFIDGVSSIHCPKCGDVEFVIDIGETRIVSNPGALATEKLAHFTLLRLLGRGGFGSVWLADDDNLGRQVALKIPVSKDDDSKSLLHEAKTAARLKHPNIVSIYEVGIEEGQIFIASEFIDGMTLRDMLSANKPTIQRTVEILIPVADALQHANDHGVVHRDIKPANIILNHDGQPFVTDFGLAKKISADASISSEGQVLGTAKYMSPEQASGKTRETDHRSDIYALGVVLFEMLTSHPPFRGNVRAIMHQKIFEDAPSARTLNPSLPKDLETICLKCLEREPEKRYQNASEVAEELTRFQNGEPIKARPVSSLEKVWRWCRRRPYVAALVASLFFSLTFGLAGVSFFWFKAEQSAEVANRLYYYSQMKLAVQYLFQGDHEALQQALHPFDEGQKLSKFKGFEWEYFDSKMDIFKQIVRIDTPVLDVAISAQGEMFAGCGSNKEIFVWNTDDGELIQTLGIPAGKFWSISFSPLNGNLASGSSDGKIRIWNPRRSNQPIFEIKHGSPVKLVRYSPDGKTLASAGTKGAVRIWNAKTLERLAEIPTGKAELKDFRFSPDGVHLAIATDNEFISIWKIENQVRVQRIGPSPDIEKFVYSDDSQTLVVGTYTGETLWWSTESGEHFLLKEPNSGAVGDLEFSKNPDRLLVVKQNGDLTLYDSESKRETNRFTTHMLSFGMIDRSKNGKTIVSGSGDGVIKIIRLDHLHLPDTIWEDQHIRQVEVLNSGQKVAVLIGDERVEIASLNSINSKRIPVLEGVRITSIAPQRSGNLLAIAGEKDEVILWNLETNQVAKTLSSGTDSPTDVLFSHDGKQLVVANRTGKTWIYNVNNFKTPLMSWTSKQPKMTAISFRPDDEEIALSFESGQVEVRNLSLNGKLKHSLNVTSVPQALCYFGEEASLAIGTNSGRLHIWNRDRPEESTVVAAHATRINTLVAFPDQKRFASGSRDKMVKIWSAETTQQITTLVGHERQIFSLSISPDGKTLVSGGLAGDVRIWRGE